jgi:hypothetical protein
MNDGSNGATGWAGSGQMRIWSGIGGGGGAL